MTSVTRRMVALSAMGAVVSVFTGEERAVAAEIPRGTILPSVTCVADPTQSYALYVPTSFDPARRWPVLFCFDPGARGKAAVERFQAAAEKFGWLVAGSNNSRNGPWEANAVAINAMIKDVDHHLPLERKRVYVAGLSGGARVACTVAASGIAQGVIACSAGFPGSTLPDKVSFPFFGTAGVTDFNYQELRRVDRELDDRKAPHRLVVFDGGHEWLPPDIALEALAWLELQAMRTGARAKDDAWIQAQAEARIAALPPARGIERLRALRSLAADFKGVVATAAFEREAIELAASRDVRDALKAERASERAEQVATDEILGAAAEGFPAAAKATIATLQAKARGTGPDRVMAVRVLQGVASSCGEMARSAFRGGDFEAAANALEVLVLVRPERAQAQVDLARARAELGETARALTALRAAQAAGWADPEKLRADKAFARLAKNPAFGAVLDDMK